MILVPLRADNGRRDKLWAWVADRWRAEHPDWPIHEGHHDEGRFNRSKAINLAAADAGEWDVAVIADSDSFVSAGQAAQAVRGARSSPCGFWLAYDQFNYLSHAMSDRIMDGYLGAWEPGVEFTMTGTCSSMVVVRRALFDEVGGFDERFDGWGGEDVGFSLSCQTFGGGLRRVKGPVWHLWHSTSVENNPKDPQWRANMERLQEYGRAAYDRDAIRELIA